MTAPGSGQESAAPLRRRDRVRWQRIASSALVILLPIYAAPLVVVSLQLQTSRLAYLCYPVIWAVGLACIWLPRSRVSR